jgi:parallel beta-helix repeat protein
MVYPDLTLCGGDALVARKGRSWAHLNNTLVDNSFSNIYVQVPIFLGYKQVQGVYLDDQLSFHTIVNNTFTSCDVGMLLGGGRNHTVTGNRFVNCTTGLNMDDRGDTWQKAYCEPGGIFEQQLDALHYKEPPYSVAYPGLVDIMAERPCDPVFNNIVGNTYCDIPNGFADVTPAQVAAWGSYMADNMEHC